MNEPDIIPRGDSKYRYVRHVYDAEQACTVREFWEEFQHDLPQLVYITQGQYALTELETFSAEQLIQIHNKHLQKRVVAHTNKNEKLSIPLDYPLKFCEVRGRNNVGPPEFLSDIVERRLPVLVQFAPSTKTSAFVSGQSENLAKLGIMTVSEVYEETYLIGNCLNLGWICRRVTLMPLYLADVLVARVTGLEEGQDKWRDLQDYMAAQIRTVSLAGIQGNRDIALYTDSEENHVYDYIRMNFDKHHDDIAEKEAKEKGDDSAAAEAKPGSKGGDSECLYVSTSVPNPYEPFSSVSVRRKNAPPLPPNHPAAEANPPPPVPRRGEAPSPPTSPKSPESAKAAAPYLNDGAGGDVDVGSLTIDELASVLRSLRLDKYAKAFKKKGVDGRILRDLVEDKKGMMKDFSMGATDFVKIKNYVETGHIPR